MKKQLVKGVQIFVIKDDQLLLGFHNRKKFYGVPGGHIEENETPEQAALRETLEESGITCTNLRLIDKQEFFNDQKQKTYLNYSFLADYLEGIPSDDPSEEISEWKWLSYEEALSKDLYPAAKDLLIMLLENHQL